MKKSFKKITFFFFPPINLGLTLSNSHLRFHLAIWTSFEIKGNTYHFKDTMNAVSRQYSEIPGQKVLLESQTLILSRNKE